MYIFYTMRILNINKQNTIKAAIAIIFKYLILLKKYFPGP